MRWIELSAAVSSDLLESLVLVLGKYGKGGVATEEFQSKNGGDKAHIVKIYLPYNRAYKNIKKEIETSLKSFHIQLIEHLLEPEDWLDSLKDHFHPFEIGEKLIIKPSWINLPLPTDRIVIELDPGAAFGTGLHPTTRLCLLKLEQYMQPEMSGLDIGTGTGILAIACAKFKASFILALDTDPVAVRAAINNTEANGVDDLIRVRRGTLSLRAQRDFKCRFDIVLANISAAAISDLAPGILKVLKNGGIFIGTGIHSQQLDAVLINLAIAGFQLEEVDSEEEWRVLVARRPFLSPKKNR